MLCTSYNLNAFVPFHVSVTEYITIKYYYIFFVQGRNENNLVSYE